MIGANRMFIYPKCYDVIVVGGGHAGVEAALAAARIGCDTMLLTMNPDSIGQMSCNPAVGGLGKGHLAREIDALGGEMGINTDMTGIQFRMLNTRKGVAVQSPRAQCDKRLYQQRLRLVCERQSNLDIKLAQAIGIATKNGRVVGVDTSIDVRFPCKTAIITTGTFLHGLIHVGDSKSHGGRFGDSAAGGLSESLRNLGLELGRLKTGTPPRLLNRSINYQKTEAQHGDLPPQFFTFWKERLFHVERSLDYDYCKQIDSIGGFPPSSALSQNAGQVKCHITFTTSSTADIIRKNIHKSPLYSGQIKGAGPRYCPSIEDKIIRFHEKERHQIFLEPEGINTEEVYVNGLSTSLPYEVQLQLVQSVLGCESAIMVRPAYAVEYDFVFPTQINPTLETKCCENLFLAGQINGTSGYEEAGAQGIIAGINAAQSVMGRPKLVLGRDHAYIGVLIDDLVTKGTSEPYRMFTSRSEHRLLLRHDNADLRLSRIGYDVGVLRFDCYKSFTAKQDAIAQEVDRLKVTRRGCHTLAEILRRPEVTYADLPGKNDNLPEEVFHQVETAIKYEGYIERQNKETSRLKLMDDKTLPKQINYHMIPNLKIEARQKLQTIRPMTLGQASRISGVSPADISALAVWLKQGLPILDSGSYGAG